MTAVVAERDLTAPRAKRRVGRALKRFTLLLVGAAAIIAAAYYAHSWWTDGRFIESTDDAYVGGDATAIAPHVAGFITSVAVTDNQHVAKDQLLIQLDDRDVRAALDRSKAVTTQREAVLDGLKARLQLQAATVAQAAAELDQRTAQSVFALKDSDRYGSLVNTTAVTKQEAERALSQGKAAKASVAAGRAGLDAAKQQVAVLQAQIAEANGAIAQAAADVRTAELDLGYTQIHSPVDGYIGNRAARTGAYIAVGSYLMMVVPSKGLWVDANFKEDQLKRIRPGAAATVTADVAPDQPMHGHVLSLAPGTGAIFSVIPPENATGNFTRIVQRVPVRILLDEVDGALGPLRPGLSTIVSIDTRTGGAAR